MDKETVIKIANEKCINQSINLTECIGLVNDYVQEIAPDKLSIIMSMFPSFPQQLQIAIIDKCIYHFVGKFNILCLNRFEKTPFGDSFIPILYYI